MAGLTKEQRAAKLAALEAAMTVTSSTPSLEEIPEVSRESLQVLTTARTRVDAREYSEKIRANRKSFSGLEQKLKYYGENPGWHRRWVNEENVPSRVEEGYRFVLRAEVSMSDSLRYGNSDVGDRVSIHGGTDKQGKPFNQYLMEIPLDIAEELNNEKSLNKVKLSEQSIRAGAVGNPQGNTRVGKEAGLPEIKLS